MVTSSVVEDTALPIRMTYPELGQVVVMIPAPTKYGVAGVRPDSIRGPLVIKVALKVASTFV